MSALFQFNFQQVVPQKREKVFGFFDSPKNLRLLTPEDMGFEMLNPEPVIMRRGALIEYRVRVMGVPLCWTTYIDQYKPPCRFVDVQLRGPYSFWHHTHTFCDHEGGTLMEDKISYLPPLGVLGKFLNHLWIQKELENIFDYRRQVIERVFPKYQESLSTERSIPVA